MQLSILSDSINRHVKNGHATHPFGIAKGQCERTLTHLVSVHQLILVSSRKPIVSSQESLRIN